MLAVSLAWLSTSAAIVTAQDTPGYAEALARYEECVDRLPFRYHVEGREKIAETRDAAKALRELRGKAHAQAAELVPPRPALGVAPDAPTLANMGHARLGADEISLMRFSHA